MKSAEVIFYVKHLGASPSERKADDVRKLASVFTVTAGSTTLGVAVEPRQYIADQLFAKADVIRVTHERVRLRQDPQTEFTLVKVSVSAVSTTFCQCTVTPLCKRNELLKSATMLAGGPSKDSSQDSRRTVGTHLAQINSELDTRGARDIAGLAHLGALIAARPCFDPRRSWSSPEQPLVIRLAAVVETASHYLS